MAPVKLSELPALLGRPYTSGPIKFSNVAIAGGQSGGSYTFSHFDGYSNLWSGLGASGSSSTSFIEDTIKPLSGASSATVHIAGYFNQSDTGILYESGGSASGLIVYIHGNTIYAQCGDGGGTGSATNRFECSYSISPSEIIYDIVFTADSLGDDARLYINGVLESSDNSTSVSQIAGGNDAGWGEVYNNVCNNRGSWSTNGSGGFTPSTSFLASQIWNSSF